MGTNAEFEIRRLRKLNGLLTIACIVLGLASCLLYQFADRPGLNIYDDLSLQYNPGLWWDNEKTIYIYYSEDMGSLAIGYFDEERGRLYDLAWIHYVESEDEAVRRSQPITPEEREQLYRERGLID